MKRTCQITLFRFAINFAIVLLLCIPLAACSVAQASEQVSVEALAIQIEQGRAPLILDVRSPKEYAAGHIPGAINIHYRDIPNQLDAIRTLLAQDEVVVYCERGVRAGIAENSLAEAGFTSVIQLTGDMPAWRAANFPVVTSVLVAE